LYIRIHGENMFDLRTYIYVKVSYGGLEIGFVVGNRKLAR